MAEPVAGIGVIGGSGLYHIEGISDTREIPMDTPFGQPSDAIIGGSLSGREIFFLPRHGKGHRILPHELNHRANIYALRKLGVRYIICVTAVGSLQPQIAPRHIVCPDQFYDRTSRRPEHTFFGNGICAHVGFAEPVSPGLRGLLVEAARANGHMVHDGGTYVNMDGPAFSTRAESNTYRHFGFDVIGMTNLGEAKLAREAEIALATLAMITDYDCWKIDEPPVSADSVISHLVANAEAAKQIIASVVPEIPLHAHWPEHRALDDAIMTSPEFWPERTGEALAPLLERWKSRDP